MARPLRLNVGCGMTPTEGWENLDNSPSLKLARVPWLAGLLGALRLLGPAQRRYIDFARAHRLRWADATRRLPCADGAAEVVYASHMLEHLDRAEAASFLAEARRVLRPGGILRLALPDLARQVERYRREGDADAFMAQLHTCEAKPRGLRGRLRHLLAGGRQHHWMYDAASLVKLVEQHGFSGARALPPGETMIPEPGALDLRERAADSVYVEARKPA